MFPPVLPTYNRADVAFVRGEGSYLFAEDGERYLDFGAGIAVNALGHAHPHLVETLREQAGKLWHTSNLYHIPGQEKLAARLVAASFADTVFFGNSGAEAIECAIKMARRFQYGAGHPERFRIITFEGAFHGRTLAAIAAGGQAKYLEGFGPKVEGFDQVPFADLAALKAAIGPQTAALLIEPVQGEGGLRPVPTEFLRTMRKLCDEHGLLLIFDEVQTGVGRTGKLFAHEWSGVTPDIMAIAKGIGGGFPMGACLATERAARAMAPGSHASTFGGNPLAMAVGNAVLDVVLAPEFLPQVRRISGYARQQLEGLVAAHPGVFAEVRGEGLMLGLKMKVPNAEFVNVLRSHHMLAVPAGDNVVRLLPPLNIEESHVREAVALLGAAARDLEAAGKTAA
ncbi:MAG: aspartate aminotransferase family protein [Alphaproteobacteria bacterium]|nr:aspartate aminotransferase family protein [Alphaproteobacteria bacterium]MDE2012335.1 aspartate aminotransferase family protein [Alphaproteobacteria bacterium]MDE2073008.1 aspartate aminotransferase family protein [Alphaproteobacteria bacterium]MDE2352059.1 aspartate aminotransferase family protein [Alphaproteobacteria bacterium]